jgi:hypothetical protein
MSLGLMCRLFESKSGEGSTFPSLTLVRGAALRPRYTTRACPPRLTQGPSSMAGASTSATGVSCHSAALACASGDPKDVVEVSNS